MVQQQVETLVTGTPVLVKGIFLLWMEQKEVMHDYALMNGNYHDSVYRKVAAVWRQDIFVGGVNNMKPKISTFCNMAVFAPKKWHFRCSNQNSKTTFIIQTFTL